MAARIRHAVGMVAALALAVAPGAALGEPQQYEPRYPPRAIVLLVASWCAPCRGELARLDAIAAAADGRAVRVLAIDDGAATQRMLRLVAPERVWRPSPDRIDRTRAALLERTAGLPYSIATNARGAICAEQGGGLDAARTAALLRRCLP